MVNIENSIIFNSNRNINKFHTFINLAASRAASSESNWSTYSINSP
ncbi:hypothetical protein vBEcoMWL3_gp062 [Escherichia phage vB_EcoM_WL-3]|nr:hypothetical protein vBEcoMWL3_gp062 [Escherichia phage vB_EcoM_WL-3]